MEKLKSLLNETPRQQGNTDTNLTLQSSTVQEKLVVFGAGMLGAKMLFSENRGLRPFGVLPPLVAVAYILHERLATEASTSAQATSANVVSISPYLDARAYATPPRPLP